MAVNIVDNTNFGPSISTNMGEVTVVLLHDFYGECGSAHQRALATIESVALYYEQYTLPSVQFFRGNKTDITMVQTDIKYVQCTPSYYFYVGDGSGGYDEYYRHNGPMNAEQIKYYIEQQRG
ncbi:MAG: hypothetical protein U5N86_05105 [Planctomycetota bacterium]|nr:hypothetical protein [Planctomycetota bacterium]